jgi:integrase
MKIGFKDALWDGSDPSYAPCILRNKRRREAWWSAPERYKLAGYNVKSVKLGPLPRDGSTPLDYAAKCRELTQEMVAWYRNQEPQVRPGSWHWLIGRYKIDEFSPLRNVKPNTRDGYLYWLNEIDGVIGHIQISTTTYEVLMRIKNGKKKKGRSVHHIANWFSALRRVARYGVLIEAPGAPRVAEILSNMRIEAPAARNVTATREQVEAIVAQADEHGLKTFAAGILIQWWFGLRAVDVRGQFLDGEWVDGLTWGMFDDDFRGFHKVISKTRKSLPEAYHFDITVVPGLRQRILEIKASLHPTWTQPEKPVALALSERGRKPSTGLAYTPSGWNQAWRRMRDAAGVPKDVWCMDMRAGAITDAAQLPGVSLSQLRNAAQHKDAATTGRYIRERSDDANRIVALRAARKSST